MIDPRSQYMIYKEQENERMIQIERKLAKQERGGCKEAVQPWYSATLQWLKEALFSGIPTNRQHTAAESPCQGEAVER